MWTHAQRCASGSLRKKLVLAIQGVTLIQDDSASFCHSHNIMKRNLRQPVGAWPNQAGFNSQLISRLEQPVVLGADKPSRITNGIPRLVVQKPTADNNVLWQYRQKMPKIHSRVGLANDIVAQAVLRKDSLRPLE